MFVIYLVCCEIPNLILHLLGSTFLFTDFVHDFFFSLKSNFGIVDLVKLVMFA